jgi:hypothetical protein
LAQVIAVQRKIPERKSLTFFAQSDSLLPVWFICHMTVEGSPLRERGRSRCAPEVVGSGGIWLFLSHFPPYSTCYHLLSVESWKVGEIIPPVSTSFHVFPPFCTFFRTLFF